MTFGEFKNALMFNTKLQVFNAKDEFMGWYKLDQFIRCDHCIVDLVWAIDENKIGIKLNID